MERPTFAVQHFLVCRRIEWEGLPGPNTARTLEGVIHHYEVAPDAEPWFEFDELWLYARLFRTNVIEGMRSFSVELLWLDAPGGELLVRTYASVSVRFTHIRPIVAVAWPLRPIRFPGLGRYKFCLRSGGRIVAREHLEIRRP